MIPVTLHVRSFNADDSVRKSQDFHFNVFVQQKWTPYLMMATLFNAVSNLNDFSEDATYRMNGELELAGHEKVQHQHDAGPCGPAGSYAHAAGGLVGRQVQSPVSQPGEDAGCDSRERHGGSAAGTAHCPN